MSFLKEWIELIIFRFGTNRLRINLARKWGVKIGRGCFINSPVSFGPEPYLISIGNKCVITSGVKFINHNGAQWVLKNKYSYLGTLYGPIVINDNCFIGVNSIILQNVVVGPNSIIASGSVVNNDIPQNSVYGGVPAKFISSLEDFLEKSKKRNTGNFSSKDTKRKKRILLNKFGHLL